MVPRRTARHSAAAGLASVLLALAALAWEALGGALPNGAVETTGEPATSQAYTSIPDGWQSWDESVAPDYVLETGRAQIRASLEEGQVSYSPLDGLGRPGLVAASLTHDVREAARERGRQQIDVDPCGWPKTNPEVLVETPDGGIYHGRFWNRSHLLADSLGGDPTRENLVTGTRMQNTGGNDEGGGMAYGEAIARDWLDAHESGTLYYSALPLYAGDEEIPRAVIVDMRSSDGQVDMELIVYNAAKGYSVDYETGDVEGA